MELEPSRLIFDPTAVDWVPCATKALKPSPTDIKATIEREMRRAIVPIVGVN
jgi:hypothetical protein